MRHMEWFEETTRGSTVNAAAAKAGVVQRTLARQLDKGLISAENVIKIALAYDVHPVGALVSTGYIDSSYAEAIDPKTAVQLISEEDLASEVLRRMKLGRNTATLTTPISELPGISTQSEVADLAQVRGSRYAADRRMREPQEGDDDYGSGA